MRYTLRRSARAGFTLVELLVASALIVLMMAVMATAFQSVLKAFSDLNSAVNLADQLRAAQDILNKDLESQHLEDEEGKPVKVSDPRVRSNVVGWRRPGQKGYFFIGQGSAPKQQHIAAPLPPELLYLAPGTIPPYVKEGLEDTVPSFRATDHWIQFTVRRSGATPNEAFITKAHPNAIGAGNLADFAPPAAGVPLLIQQWAEVAYFLRPTGVLTDTNGDPNAKAIPVFALHRRQRGLVNSPSPLLLNPPAQPTPLQYDPTDTTKLPTTDAARYPDLAVQRQGTGPYQYLTIGPGQVTDPNLRLGSLATDAIFLNHPTPTAPPPGLAFFPYPIPPRLGLGAATTDCPDYGSDILLANVVSMQIQVMSDMTSLTNRPLPTLLPPADTTQSRWYPPAAYPVPQPLVYHDLGFGYEHHGYAPEASLPGYPAVFDTAQQQFNLPPPPAPPIPPPPHPPTVPPGSQSIANVQAVQITLRVYDPKTKLTRQITIRKPV